MSFSGAYSHGTLDWHVDVNAYVINSQLTLWNNFTHFLDDPINGDQHGQTDIRTIFGGSANYARSVSSAGGIHGSRPFYLVLGKKSSRMDRARCHNNSPPEIGLQRIIR